MKKSFSIKSKDGLEYYFTKSLIGKYVFGNGRRDGVDMNRLQHLPKAVETVANGMPNFHPNDNPPQKTFFNVFEDGHGMIVFADAMTREIRGFFPSRSPSKQLKIHLKGIF